MESEEVIFAELVHLLDPEPHAGAFNMALDEVLLRDATRPLLRAYTWARPALSFGYFARWAEVAPRWPGRELVRRWTGGGIVPHGEDWTYTLVVPRSLHFSRLPAAESYRLIHQAVAAALGATPGALSLAKAGPRLGDECFANPVPHDVLANGVKVAGAAQRRTRHGLLHQGSIQRSDLSANFAADLAAALAHQISERPLSDAQRQAAEQLDRDKYGSPEWRRRF